MVRTKGSLLLLTLVTCVLAGCNSGLKSAATANHAYYVDADEAAQVKADPSAPPMEDPSKVEGKPSTDNPPLDQVKAEYEAASKSPQDHQKLLNATMKLAEAYMYYPADDKSQDLNRSTKYKMALKYYQEALKLDPQNSEAKDSAKMIIQIYQSMGKPVPR